VFYESHREYLCSSDLPPEAEARIPARLRAVFDCGKAEFFAPLKQDFPQLFASLLESCGPLKVYEYILREERLSGGQVKQHLFCLGADAGPNQLRIDAMLAEPGSKLHRIKYAAKLACLPVEFAHFYTYMDGIGLLESGEIIGRELPLGFSHWRRLGLHLLDQGMQLPRTLADETDLEDMRLFIRTRSDHLVLTHVSEAGLYWAGPPELDVYHPIPDPAVALDPYMADVIKGHEPDLAEVLDL